MAHNREITYHISPEFTVGKASIYGFRNLLAYFSNTRLSELEKILRHATDMGHPRIVKMIIRFELNLEVNDAKYIFYAAVNGSETIVKMLHKTQLTEKEIKDLYLAICDTGNVNFVKYALRVYNIPSFLIKTSLHYAITGKRFKLVKFLIYYIQPTLDVLNQFTTFAYNSNIRYIAKYLIKKGSDVNQYNGALLTSVSYFGDLDMVSFLIEKGADVHLNNDSALSHAVGCSYYEVVRLLVENGANPKARISILTGISNPCIRSYFKSLGYI
jgi:ankyrin repeat protein